VVFNLDSDKSDKVMPVIDSLAGLQGKVNG
jgi:hypothetical protein